MSRTGLTTPSTTGAVPVELEANLNGEAFELVQHGAAVSSCAVASWAEFEAAEPKFASRVRSLMAKRQHLTMATVRRDGAPRISGTEVEFADGQLWIGSMAGAVKALDLRRDPRISIHGPTTDPPADNPVGWRGEAQVGGISLG